MERLDRYNAIRARVKKLGEHGQIASNLIYLLERHINMALLASQRIAEDDAALSIPRATAGPDPFAFFSLYADIHFYLVAVDNVRKVLDRLNTHINKTLNKTLKDVLKPYHHFLKCAKSVRDHHEHSDQRVGALGAKGTRDRDMAYQGLDGWNYQVLGESIKVGPPAAQVLINLYADVEKDLKKLYPSS
jgi:hypothetical protein